MADKKQPKGRPWRLPYGIEARTTPDAVHIIALNHKGMPNDPAMETTLPKVPSPLIWQTMDLFRAVWEMHQRCVTVLLKLDFSNHLHLPRQQAWPEHAVAQLVDPSPGPILSPLLRTAGSITTAVDVTREMIPTLCMPYDGVHLFVNPTKGMGTLWTAMQVQGRLAWVSDLPICIANQGEATLAQVAERIPFTEAGNQKDRA